MSIKRYHIEGACDWGCCTTVPDEYDIEEREDGPWVRWEDVKPLIDAISHAEHVYCTSEWLPALDVVLNEKRKLI